MSSQLDDSRGSDSGYEGDTEQNELNDFFEDGKIPGVTPDKAEDEVPHENKNEENEEIVLNKQASQAVEDLEIEIVEQNFDEEPIAIRKGIRIKNPIQRYEETIIKIRPKKTKTTKKQVIPPPVSEDNVSSQVAYDVFIDETGSQKSAAKVLIVKNVRLETRKPDDQAKVIYGADFKMPEYCYLCVCLLSERVSANHNARWGYDRYAITSSFDHTVPVNFSSVVGRNPSQYNTNPEAINKIEEYEKNYLKSNGKYACFHCNFTKSQMMFITCKVENKDINFQDFKPNVPVIKNFVDRLYENDNDWSKGPDGKNTLYECIRKYHEGNIDSWKQKCIKSITDSAEEVCNMIKQHVDQKSVIKRFYYTKLLIQEAYKQLETDPVYLALEPKKKPIYTKKYIAHVIAKAEATNPNYGKPWNTTKKPITSPVDKTKVKNTNTQQRQQEQSTGSIQRNIDRSKTARNEIMKEKREASVKPDLPLVTLPSGERLFPTRIKSAQERFEEQQQSVNRLSRSKKRAGSRRKRKTYRGVRLF